MKKPALLFIAFYQAVLSPDKGVLRGLYPLSGACIMHPSCSEYTRLAIEKYGTIRGVTKGVLRIGRCHPFQKKLIDVP